MATMVAPRGAAVGRRRRRYTSPSSSCLSGGALERARDRRRRVRAVARDPHHQDCRQRTEDRRRGPGLGHRRPAGKRREECGDRDRRIRASRPRAETHELCTGAVILGGDEQANRSEKSAADFQVPALVVAPALDHGTGELERRLDGAQSFLEIAPVRRRSRDRKSTRLNSSHVKISYAVFCLKKKNPNEGVYNVIWTLNPLELAHPL